MNAPGPLDIAPGKLYRCKLLHHGWWVNDISSGDSFQLPIGAMLLCIQPCHTVFPLAPVFLTPCGNLVKSNIRVLDAEHADTWEEVSEP